MARKKTTRKKTSRKKTSRRKTTRRKVARKRTARKTTTKKRTTKKRAAKKKTAKKKTTRKKTTAAASAATVLFYADRNKLQRNARTAEERRTTRSAAMIRWRYRDIGVLERDETGTNWGWSMRPYGS